MTDTRPEKKAHIYAEPEGYYPSVSRGVDHAMGFKRITSVYAMFDVLHAFKCGRLTQLETVNYLSADTERQVEEACYWGQQHPEYQTSRIVR